MAARSKAWICACSLTGIEGSNPSGNMDVCHFLSVACCQQKCVLRSDLSSRGVLLSVVCVTECDSEASTVRRSWPIGGCCALKEMPVG